MEKTLVILDLTLRGGYTNVPNVVLAAPGLSLEAKGLYITLLMSAQKNGFFPGRQRLTELTECSKKTIDMLVRELEQKGYFPIPASVSEVRS
ncbi:MAG: hypothetical protein VR67_12155 [Peptococcaceae bacterium BRH_c8a]|nr:MAG: hypothetical protein VR67_12155 [Peptococcaceae bacterium BRH_c8a]